MPRDPLERMRIVTSAAEKRDELVERGGLAEVDSATHGRLDERAHERVAANDLAVLQADVDREAVESGDVAIEEDDGDAGPIRMLLLRHVRKMILPDLCLMRTAEVGRAPEDHRATDRAAAARAALADLAVMKK